MPNVVPKFTTGLLVLAGLFACGAALAQDASSTPPQSQPAPVQRIRVPGDVQDAKLVSQPLPIYPESAKKAAIEGTLVLHALIAKNGSVQEVQYVSGPRELMRAAMDAVKQWRYQPTFVQRHPVEVDSTISVVFTLGDPWLEPPALPATTLQDAKARGPFDELDVLAFLASTMDTGYAMLEVQQRGVAFEPDPLFSDVVGYLNLHADVDAIVRKSVTGAGVPLTGERKHAFEDVAHAVEQIQKGDRRPAEGYYQDALRLAPESATLHEASCGNRILINEYDEAEPDCRLAVKIWPEDADAHMLLASALMGRNRNQEAIPEAQEALKIYPRNKSALMALGIAMTRSGQYADAVPIVRQGVEHIREMPLLKKSLGVCLLHTGDLDGAIEQLTAYLNAASNDAEGHYELGAALRAKGKNDEALAQFQEAHRLDPVNPVFASVANPGDDAKSADQPIGPKPDDGFFAGNVYTNKFFGFTYEYPKKWVTLNPSVGPVLSRFGENLLVGGDPTLSDTAEAAVRHTYWLLVASGVGTEQIEKTPAIPKPRVRMVQIRAMDASLEPGLKSGEDFARGVAEKFGKNGSLLQITAGPEELTVQGRDFWRISATAKANGAVAYSTEIVTIEKGYILQFAFSDSEAAGLEESVKTFQSLHFADVAK